MNNKNVMPITVGGKFTLCLIKLILEYIVINPCIISKHVVSNSSVTTV